MQLNQVNVFRLDDNLQLTFRTGQEASWQTIVKKIRAAASKVVRVAKAANIKKAASRATVNSSTVKGVSPWLTSFRLNGYRLISFALIRI
jgi:crotonobetainyl-CoA:carnitine CoA-transferase CaiB-like acyl-CoA transferase